MTPDKDTLNKTYQADLCRKIENASERTALLQARVTELLAEREKLREQVEQEQIKARQARNKDEISFDTWHGEDAAFNVVLRLLKDGGDGDET